MTLDTPVKVSKTKRNKQFQFSGDAVKEIVKPLQTHFNLNSFVYKKIFNDGSEYSISTHPDWLHQYFEEELYQYNVLELEPENYVKGQILWSQITTHTPILDAVKSYDIANGITAVRPYDDGVELYYLGGHKEDRHFGQRLLNNMDLIDQFFNYFKYQGKELIEQIDKNRIIIPKKFENNCYKVSDIPYYQNESVRQQFLHDIQKQGIAITVDNKIVTLTKREISVARELLQGKSMREIGEVLYISPRTVETHINHLKEKFHLNKRSDLIVLLKKAL